MLIREILRSAGYRFNEGFMLPAIPKIRHCPLRNVGSYGEAEGEGSDVGDGG